MSKCFSSLVKVFQGRLSSAAPAQRSLSHGPLSGGIAAHSLTYRSRHYLFSIANIWQKQILTWQVLRHGDLCCVALEQGEKGALLISSSSPFLPPPLLYHLPKLPHWPPLSILSLHNSRRDYTYAATSLLNHIGRSSASRGRKESCVLSPTAARLVGVLLFWQWVNTLSSPMSYVLWKGGHHRERGGEEESISTLCQGRQMEAASQLASSHFSPPCMSLLLISLIKYHPWSTNLLDFCAC